MNDDVQFDEFVLALSEFEFEDDEIQATAHTSAVSVTDWEKVERAVRRA
jgi:hypothetical protein